MRSFAERGSRRAIVVPFRSEERRSERQVESVRDEFSFEPGNTWALCDTRYPRAPAMASQADPDGGGAARKQTLSLPFVPSRSARNAIMPPPEPGARTADAEPGAPLMT